MRAGSLVALALALAALAPGHARGLPPPPIVVFDALLQVCDGIDRWGCTYGTDIFWSGEAGMRQGLYHPTLGPPATTGPVRLAMVTTACSSGGPCALSIEGTLGPNSVLGIGAYCEAFEMDLRGRLSDGAVDMEFTFSWSNPGGPVDGQAFDTIHPGTQRVTGWLAARGTPTGGDCGIDAPLTSLQVEGALFFS